jgi:DNA topoisomerase VI subunit B
MATITEYDLQPDPRILPMLGEINLVQWRCIAELVDNCVDGFLDMSAAGDTPGFEVHVSVPLIDSPGAVISVRDNGPGMTPDVLEKAVRAGWSGNASLSGKLGLFGMGFNIATARLGTVTTVWTTRAGETEEVGVRIDFDQLIEARILRGSAIAAKLTAQGIIHVAVYSLHASRVGLPEDHVEPSRIHALGTSAWRPLFVRSGR